jgi:hypothetical protein
MSIWRKIFGLNKKKEKVTDILSPEMIEHLPAADDATFYRDSKRLLQRFDEYITAAESELEELSIELDDILEQNDAITCTIKKISKEGSWHEKSLLLKFDRLTLHGDNLKQRIEIYSQNIKIYLNLISKIQDVKAMRMNGLCEDKIETIWLEFRETVDHYRNRLMTEEAGFESIPISTHKQEQHLKKLRASMLTESEEVSEEVVTQEVTEEPTETPQERSLDALMGSYASERNIKELHSEDEEDQLELA